MKKYEISFASLNSETYPKTITAMVMEPDNINDKTGAMLFTHTLAIDWSQPSSSIGLFRWI